MDFQALPRRDLQALCKRNAIRANMSNAAMADALRALHSVEGIDEIRPPGMSAVAGEEQRHGCPLPRGGSSAVRMGTAAADKTEEAAPAARDCSQRRRQNTAEQDATVPVDAQVVSTGKRRARRSRVSKSKKVSDQEEETAAAAEQNDSTDPILFEGKSVARKEQQNACPLPGGRTTRSRAAAHKTEDAVAAPDTLQSTQKTAVEGAVVPVEVDEISTGKRRTRKSRRSKVKVGLSKNDGEEVVAAACTEPIVVSDKSCDDPKEEAVMDEGAAKPQEGEVHCQNPSGKRRTRKSKRSKVKMALDKKEEAATKELIADSCDGIIGSAVVSDKACNDFKEENVSVVEAGDTNFQEGIELEPTSNTQKYPSLAIMKDLPIQCVQSMVESRGPLIEMSQDASVRGGGSFSELPVDEMSFKINPNTQESKDRFILTGEVDQSNLLVNTLDRLVKPMYKFTVKEEKKQGECWWMLM